MNTAVSPAAVATAGRGRIRVRADTTTWAGWAAVVVLALVAHAVVHVTGGSPNALNHTGYLAVILAAYLFGWRGGLAAGLLVGTVLARPRSACGHPPV